MYILNHLYGLLELPVLIWYHIWSIWAPMARLAPVVWASPRIPPKTVNARHWNDDVLHCILCQASSSDLASAALVCRDWLSPARKSLYTRLVFNMEAPNASLLAYTLHTYSHLRDYIRFLWIRVSLTNDLTLLNWLGSLLNHALHEFHVDQCLPSPAIRQIMLACPAVRTVSHLTATGPFIQSMEDLRSCLKLPLLESFCLSWPYGSDSLALGFTIPRLRRLSISTYEYNPSIGHLLSNVGPQLERFDLDVGGSDIKHVGIQDLSRVLADRGDGLRRLSIRTHYRPAAPFLDDLIPRLPHLLHLYCGYGTYTKALFDRLNPKLQVLELEAHHRSPFPVSDVMPLVDHVRMGASDLSALAVVALAVNKRPELEPLKNACHDAGVRFHVLSYAAIELLS